MMILSFDLVFVLAGCASEDIEKRIFGGVSCKEDRQYHVQIDSVQGGMTCGGALINTRWVITASHCAERMVKVKIGLNNQVNNPKILNGTLILNNSLRSKKVINPMILC